MSIIKHISVYDGSNWNSYPIGAEATNISYNDNGTVKSLNTVINDLNNSVSGYDSELARLEEKIDSKVSGTFVTVPQAGSASGAQSANVDSRPDLDTPQYWRMRINSIDTNGDNIQRMLFATDSGIGLWDGVNNQQVWSLSSTLNTSISTLTDNVNNTIKNVSKSGNNFIFEKVNGTKITLADADTNTTYSANAGLKMNGTTVQHSTSTTAGGVGPGSNYNSISFSVPYIYTDAYGHVTSKTTRTIGIPASSTSAHGYMSTTQVTKLNGIATGATKNALSIKEVAVSKTMSFAANGGYSTGTVSFTVPSGYTYTGIVNYNYGSAYLYSPHLTGTPNGSVINYFIRNFDKVAINNQTIKFYAICIKI